MPSEVVSGFVVVCTHKALEVTENGEVHRDTHDAEIHQELEYGIAQSIPSEYIYQPGGGIRLVNPSPLLSRATHGQCMAVVKGTITNLQTLVTTHLAGDSTAAGEPNAAEVICKMFEKSGYSMVSALEGEFIFCLYDSKTERVLAARSSDVYALYEGRSEHNSLIIAGGTGQFFLPPGTHKMRSIHPGSFKWGWNAKPRKIASLQPNTKDLNSLFPADPAHKFHALSNDPEGKVPLGTESHEGGRDQRRSRRGRGRGQGAGRGKQEPGELQSIVDAVLESRDQDPASGEVASAADGNGSAANNRRRRRRNNRNRQGATADGAEDGAAAPQLPDAAELPGAAALSDSPPPRNPGHNRKPKKPQQQSQSAGDQADGTVAADATAGVAADGTAAEGTGAKRPDRQRRRKPRPPPNPAAGAAAVATATDAEAAPPAEPTGSATASTAGANRQSAGGRRRRRRRDGPKDAGAEDGAVPAAGGEQGASSANAQTAVTRAIQGLAAAPTSGPASTGGDAVVSHQVSVGRRSRRRNNRQRKRGPQGDASGTAAGTAAADAADAGAPPAAGAEADAAAPAQDGSAEPAAGSKQQRQRRRRRRGPGKENADGEQPPQEQKQGGGGGRRVWREKQKPAEGEAASAPLAETNHVQPGGSEGNQQGPAAASSGQARDAIVAALPAEV